MTWVIGIDLGTTNCCVAVMDGSAPRVIANRQGYKTTPSVIAALEDGRRVVGQIAQRQAITNARNTVYGSKRLLGLPFDSEHVKWTRDHVAFEIVRGPAGDTRVLMRGRQHTIPEISAMLLQEMRVIAEDALGTTIDKAVVTVPAYFSDSQRQAVRDAGLIAGLDVLRIVNEPTAAALAYGYHRGLDRMVAVYDLGGGTFDISIVQCGANETFKVVATTGDAFLGGEDFDERVMGWLVEGFELEHGIDLRKNPVSLQRVRDAAAKAKHDLSTLDRTEIQLPFIADGPRGPINLHYEIKRSDLEALTHDLVARTIEISAHALACARLDASQISDVILVGGMTRMPAVQAAVAQLFGRAPSKNVHPDEAVAIGAALQGAALAKQIDDVSLEDVVAHSLGIAMAGDKFGVVIPANTRVPVRVPSRFTTSRDEQRTVKIAVLEGESEKASESELLDEFLISGLRSAKAGEVELEVAFAIDADGIFSVSAKDLETGEETLVTVGSESQVSEDEIKRLAEESRTYLEARRNQEVMEGLRQSALSLLAEHDRVLDKLERAQAIDPVSLGALRAMVRDTGIAVPTMERSALAEQLIELEESKDRLEAMVR
jgi:molecular chaperone DnaK